MIDRLTWHFKTGSRTLSGRRCVNLHRRNYIHNTLNRLKGYDNDKYNLKKFRWANLLAIFLEKENNTVTSS